MPRSNARSRVGRAAALLLLSLLAAPIANARHGHRSHGGVAGAFDGYLLALSWSPAYCAGGGRGPECTGRRPYGFVVHGLWPQRDRGRIEYCPSRERVPAQTVRALAPWMPSRSLVFHEWKAHGSCSGLAPRDYFAQLVHAASGVAIPFGFRAPAAARTVAPRVIVREFRHADPAMPVSAIVVVCRHGAPPRFTELRICLDRSLRARPCSRAVRARRCRAPLVQILPMRRAGD